MAVIFQYYRAVYGFQARSDIEISMAEGQIVPVLQQHDLDGNPDWWLIEVDGNQGYVPANYLYKVQWYTDAPYVAGAKLCLTPLVIHLTICWICLTCFFMATSSN